MKHKLYQLSSSTCRALFITIFLALVGVLKVWGTDVTFTVNVESSNTTTMSKGDVTVSTTSGTFSRTDNYRIYANQSMTITSSGGNITQVAFTITQNTFTANVGTWTDNTKTWTGDASSVTFSASGGQVRITSFTVTINSSVSCSECTYYVYNGSTWVSIGTTGFTDVVLAPPTLPDNNHGAGNGCWTTDKNVFTSCTYYASGDKFRYVPNPGGAAPTSVNKPGSGTCELYAVYAQTNGCLSTTVTSVQCARIWDEPEPNTPSVSGSSVTLSWSSVTGASGYHLYVTDGDSYEFDDDVNSTSKTLSGLAAGTYMWTVAANSSDNDACDSNPADGDYFEIVGCTDISGSTVSSANISVTPAKTSADISWNAVANASSYEVKVYAGATATGSPVFTASPDPTSTSCTATGLTANTQYTVAIKAKNACSTSSTAGTKTFTTLNLTLYTVTFVNSAGSAPSPLSQTSENQALSIPQPAACDEWDFAGWKVGGSQSSTTSDPTGSGTWITSNSWPKSYTPTGNITVYAVFKQTTGGGSGASAGTTLWSEDFSGYSANDVPDETISSSDTHTGTTVYSGSVTYACTNGTGTGTTEIYNDNTAGGEAAPELMVCKNSGTFAITGIPKAGASVVTVYFTTNNQNMTVASSTTGYTGSYNQKASGEHSFDITCGTASTFDLTFTGPSGNSNIRLDDIQVKVKTAGASGTTTWTSSPDCATSKELTSITIDTDPTRLNYVTGELFDPTGAVVTAHYDDSSYETVTATTTWSPSTALTAGTGQTATASYTEGGVTKTATVTYNVYTPTLAKKDETGTTIDLVSPAISRTAAVVTADATGNSYQFKEWQITGGTFSGGVTTTSDNPATITSVSGAVTVTAVYYKPVTVTWYVNGNGSSNIYHTDTHARGWGLMYPSNPDPAEYSCDGKVFVGWTRTFPYTNASVAPTFVSSGTAINSDESLYAVFAVQTQAGTPPTWTKTAFGSVSAGTYLMCTADGHVFNGEISSGRGQITAAAFTSFAGNSTFNVDAPVGSCELTFAAVTNGFSMYAAGKGYLYCSESTASHIGWHESETSYWYNYTSHWRYYGARDGSGNATAIVGYSNSDFRNYVSPGSNTAAVVFLKKTAAGTPATYSDYTTSCACEGYSFHTGSGTDDQVKATNTRTCFVQDGTDNNMWKIENYVIPSTTKFFVGYQDEFQNGSSPYDYSVVAQWTDVPTKSNNKWQGQMFLVPVSDVNELNYFAVGQATGAKGTLRVYNNSGDKNKYVNFEPDGYGITYGGTSHAFGAATSNKRETEVVTLPDVSSTTYTVGLATATAGTYVTCAHSKAAENINAMGVSIIEGGKKKILLVPGSFDADGAVYAIWDGTNSAWGDGTTKLMTDVDGDGIWEGVVASTCVKINLVRLSSGTTASNISWDRRWNQTGDINVYDLLNKYTITSLNGNNCAYSTTAIQPATGQKGKFRMWDNSKEQNWFVHFIPYYHLTYDGNGGGDAVTNLPASPADVSSEGNDAARTVTVANMDPVRSGYRFMGWADTQAHATAGTVDHAKNTTIVMTGDKTIYAVWKQEYTVTYDLDGGSASPACDGGSYIQGESVTVCTSTPTKAGSDFAGWSYSPSVTVTAGSFPMPAEAVTITATWTDHTYVLSHTGSNYTNTEGTTTIKSSDTPLTLTYTCTGSYGFPNDVTITGGGKATWTKDTHYTWTVASDKKSATLVIGSTTISADVDIAITMATTYTVTYVHHDKGTYSGGSTTQVVFSNDNSITLPTVTEVSCGLYDSFEGWIASGSEYSESTTKPATVYAGGSSYTVTSDVTLRALYSKCEGDGGQVYHKITTTASVTNGTYILVSSNDPARVYSGYGGATYGSSVSGLTADGDDYTSTLPEDAKQITVTVGTGNNAGKFAMYNADREKYLTYSGSSNTLNESNDIVYIWELTTAGTINNNACPAGVLHPNGFDTRVLQCNHSSSYRFACYANNSSYEHVFLYKLIDKCTKSYATNPSCIKPSGVHVRYNANTDDASLSMSCSGNDWTYKVEDAVNKYPKLASSHSFCTNATRDEYTLIGWNTQANGLGTTYEITHSYSSLPVSGELDGENWVTLNLFAMWASAVKFNLGNASGGTGVPDVVEADGGFMLPEPTAAQLGTIPCEYSFYGWSETSVSTPTTSKPTLIMPGTKYTGSARTLYAVYRKGEAGSNPDLFSLSYTSSGTKYYVAAPSGITTAPSTWDSSDKVKKFSATTDADEALAFGTKSIEGKTIKTLYWMYEAEEVYVYWKDGNGGSLANNKAEDTDYGWTITGTTDLTFSTTYPGKDPRQIVFTAASYGDPATFNASTSTATSLHKEEASTTTYTYATNPSCETTATLAFVTNGGTINYPTSYTSANYEDLTVPTTVYLPTATFPGEWVFEGWMKGSEVTSTHIKPESVNFIEVTLNTTQYTADAVGTTTFYAVYSKTVDDKQFDPNNEGTYKLYTILSDGSTKYYMPTWGGTQTTLDEVTVCASTGEYTITPGTGEHAGQYKITHVNGNNTYTLGVRSDDDTQFKNDANAWWNIEASSSGKGTYRITIVGSSNRCLCYGGTGFFGNYLVRDVNSSTQPGYRDMEIGECIYTEYTSTPENIPYITITGSPVKITSTSGERVYSPTKVHIEAHNFASGRTLHFTASGDFGSPTATANTNASGAYSGDIDIYYQPSTTGTGNIVNGTLTVDVRQGTAAELISQTFTAIKGRNMPQNFVIAVKSGSQWYALPDDCHSSGTPTAVPIEVNDATSPTAASLVPHNVEWRLSDVVNSNNRPKDKIYFYEPNMVDGSSNPYYYTLYAGATPNIQTNAQLSNVSGENSYTYEWGLSTSDLCAYTISNANVNKNLSINTSGTFGTHATNVVSDVLYLLPITAYYTPAEFQVVEWKANSVVVMYLGNAAKASVQVGGNTEGDDQTLSDVKVDHGVYELAATGLTSTSAAFESLQIVFKNAGGTEIGRSYVAIPAIINGEVLTSEYESKKDLAESNDVVILKNGKLTTTGTGTDASSYKFTNVTVYGGGKLDIASGTKLGVTGSLVLRAGGVSSGSYEYIYPQMNLGGTLTNSSGKFYYEYVTDYTHWYHFVLPFDGTLSTIHYPTEYYGSAVAANNKGSWVIKRYAGEIRATGEYDAWKDIETESATAVTAGHGYIFWGAPKKVTANGVKDRQAWGIQRIAMSKAADAAKTAENANKTVIVHSYSEQATSTKPNDQGWNLVGNPYMVNLTAFSSDCMIAGMLIQEKDDNDKWTGKWKYNDEDVRYVTVPDDHFNNYVAKTCSTAIAQGDFMPGRSFFVQIAADGEVVDDEITLTFLAANRKPLMPALFARSEEKKVDIETGIVMSDETLKDEVNFWIKTGKTAEYENNADYPKTPNSSKFNIYGVHSHGDLSWVAISPVIAAGSMAIGYQVPAAGDYMLSLSETYVSDDIEHIFVTDHEASPEETVDLVERDYIFHVNQAETNNTRFTVSIKLIDEDTGTTTGIDNLDVNSDVPTKFIYQDKMYILYKGVIYDATGKRVSIIKR